jgi:hypothetical protein
MWEAILGLIGNGKNTSTALHDRDQQLKNDRLSILTQNRNRLDQAQSNYSPYANGKGVDVNNLIQGVFSKPQGSSGMNWMGA